MNELFTALENNILTVLSLIVILVVNVSMALMNVRHPFIFGIINIVAAFMLNIAGLLSFSIVILIILVSIIFNIVYMSIAGVENNV